MKFLSAKNIPVLALLISGGLLAGAFYYEHVEGYLPCVMCWWQRYAHFAILGLAILALFASRSGEKLQRIFAFLIVLAFLGSFGLAFWHVGVEYSWWPGPQTCSAPGGIAPIGDFNSEDFFKDMNKITPPSCKDAVWHFMGISMAGWNAIISLGGAVLSAMGLRRAANV